MPLYASKPYDLTKFIFRTMLGSEARPTILSAENNIYKIKFKMLKLTSDEWKNKLKNIVTPH